MRDLLKALIDWRLIVVGEGLIGLEISWLVVGLWRLGQWRIVFWWISWGLRVDERLVGDFRIEVVLI